MGGRLHGRRRHCRVHGSEQLRKHGPRYPPCDRWRGGDYRDHQRRHARSRDTYIFPIEATDWTHAIGGTDIGTTLANAFLLRILNNPSVSFQGATEEGTLLVDNIQSIPEPGTFGLLAAGLAGVCFRRRADSGRVDRA